MKAAIYNLEIEQGSTFKRVFTVVGATWNLTPYTPRMVIRQQPGSPVLFDSDAHAGSVVINNATTLTIEIPASVTATFKFDQANYDLELNDAGAIYKMIKGKVLLNKEYTR